MKKWTTKCSNCGREVEIMRKVNKCECNARIKILDYDKAVKERWLNV